MRERGRDHQDMRVQTNSIMEEITKHPSCRLQTLGGGSVSARTARGGEGEGGDGKRIKEGWFIIIYGLFSHLFCLLLRKLISFLGWGWGVAGRMERWRGGGR